MDFDRALSLATSVAFRQSACGPRRNLLFVRLSSPSEFESWYRPGAERSWDLMLSYYRLATNPFLDADYWTCGGISKFTAVKNMYDEQPNLFLSYDRLMFIDDDLSFEFGDIDRIFAEAGRLDLSLAQPALTKDSHFSWEITRAAPNIRARYTNFVEVMMPVFSRDAFRICVETFDKSVSSWGLDEAWPHLIGDTHRNIAIIDAYTARHMRAVDVVGGAFYRHLAELGVDPYKERKLVWQTYGFQPEQHKVHGQIPWTEPDMEVT